MTWQKGFFRIWILVSILWIGYLATDSYEGILHPWIGNHGYVYKADIFASNSGNAGDGNLERTNKTEPPLTSEQEAAIKRIKESTVNELSKYSPLNVADYEEFADYSGRFQELEELSKAGLAMRAEFPLDVLFPDVLFVPAGTRETEIDIRAKTVAKIINTNINAQRTSGLQYLFSIALLPPIVLLLLGLAFAWIIAGFNATKD